MKYQTQKVSIGSDHAGYELKAKLETLFVAAGLQVHDHGPHTADSVDYPDHAHPVAKQVADEGILGVLICGSGNGVCMTANKHTGIRAALCWNKELAMLARQHNDANILCIPARFVSEAVALEMADAFLTTAFEGGRHAIRVNKISC
jgi:ribose 5-phosphate isomerase B